MVAKTNPGPFCEYAPTAVRIKTESTAPFKRAHYQSAKSLEMGEAASQRFDGRQADRRRLWLSTGRVSLGY